MVPRLVPEISPLDAFCDGAGAAAGAAAGGGAGIGDSRSWNRMIHCGLNHVRNKDFTTQNSSQDIEALRLEALSTLVMVEHTYLTLTLQP